MIVTLFEIRMNSTILTICAFRALTLISDPTLNKSEKLDLDWNKVVFDAWIWIEKGYYLTVCPYNSQKYNILNKSYEGEIHVNLILCYYSRVIEYV